MCESECVNLNEFACLWLSVKLSCCAKGCVCSQPCRKLVAHSHILGNDGERCLSGRKPVRGGYNDKSTRKLDLVAAKYAAHEMQISLP